MKNILSRDSLRYVDPQLVDWLRHRLARGLIVDEWHRQDLVDLLTHLENQRDRERTHNENR